VRVTCAAALRAKSSPAARVASLVMKPDWVRWGGGEVGEGRGVRIEERSGLLFYDSYCVIWQQG